MTLKKVLGLGAGLGLHTKTGLLKLRLPMEVKDQKINFNNTILQLHLQYQILSQFIKDQT
jgi:hypothetical protein